MKAILVIGDGMADRPVKELGWKTPLEAANKPSLNQLAKNGICGILDPISPGVPPGSDTATLALLGYDALEVYSGRGALEASGSGVKILPGDIAFRCNFATADKNMIVTDRRAGRIANEDAAELAESLNRVELKKTANAKFRFRSTIQHRAVLVIRGPKLSTVISDSDPGIVGEKVLEVRPLDKSSEAKLTAKIANELLHAFHQVLKEHPVNQERVRDNLPPANVILCRGVGTLPNVKPLSDIYNVKAVGIAATPLVRGVCKAVGMKALEVKGITGTPLTDYLAKARAAVHALKSCDFVLLHVKAADIASHDGNPKQKTEIIERIDDMLGYIAGHIDSNSTYVAVTADHTTSCSTGNHEGDPVPISIAGPYVRIDKVRKYDERSCAEGGLGRIKGVDLMPILMNLIGRTSKFGS